MQVFRSLPPVRVTAACDTDSTRLAEFRSQHGIEHGFAGLEDLLQSCHPDFVVVATPPSTHAALCRTAIDHGVSVLLEKPACLSLGEAQALAARSQSAGVPVAVMQNYRFKAAVLKALALQRSGELGELRRIDCVYHGRAPSAQKETWRRTERRDRLLLYELAEHFVDTEIAFAGPVEEVLGVHATGRNDEEGTLAVHALVKHASGTTGCIDLQLRASAESVRVELHGSRRRVVLKFFPEGFASYRGVITPLHEIFAESARAARFAWGFAAASLLPGRVSRQAVSHWRYAQKYVRYLQGKEDRLPLSLEESLPTVALLEELAEAVCDQRASSP